jgi:hypothetical protein
MGAEKEDAKYLGVEQEYGEQYIKEPQRLSVRRLDED